MDEVVVARYKKLTGCDARITTVYVNLLAHIREEINAMCLNCRKIKRDKDKYYMKRIRIITKRNRMLSQQGLKPKEGYTRVAPGWGRDDLNAISGGSVKYPDPQSKSRPKGAQ